MSVVRGYLGTGWGQVHLRSPEPAGRGPVMVMSHQTPLHSGHYDRVLPLLSRFCKPVVFDTPGYGLSDPAPPGWEVADYAGLLWMVADHMGAGRSIVFGRATGSIMALEAAAQHPDRTMGLVLHGFPVYSEADRSERLASDFANPIHPRSDGSHLHDLWDRVLGQYPYLSAAEAQWHVEAYLMCGADFATGYRAMWRYDPLPAVASLTMPVHLLGGDRDRVGHWFEPSCALIPSATSHLFEDATDFIAHDQPERFAREIGDFVARVTGA